MAQRRRDGAPLKVIAAEFGLSEAAVSIIFRIMKVKKGRPATFRCGHPNTPENTYHYAYGRQCITCKRAKARAYHRRRRGVSPVELDHVWAG